MIRNLVYIMFFAVIAVSVIYKARIIKGKDKQEVISITEEWKKYGKPVDTVYAVKGDVHCLEKISGIIGSDDIIYCQVSSDIVSKLRKGQEFTAVLKGKALSGHVRAVSGKMDMLTGLYAVKLKITTENGFKQKSIVVAKVRVNTLKNVLKIPQRAVVRDNSHTYCWVVRDDMVEKRDVVTGADCESDIQIVSGVKLNEQVCVNGLVELSDKDRVRVRNARGAEQ
ncbi:efflux RND transporter periplasmic adaptor subunit [Elusimicrobiota bacterium]